MINWVQNYSKSTKKLTYKNGVNFFVAWYRYLFGKDWNKRQALWRESQVKINSPECIKAGHCVDCFCDFPEKYYEQEGCGKCYPDWMDQMTWIKFELDAEI